MFLNILRKKRLVSGEVADTRCPESIFINEQINTLDTLYIIYCKCNKSVFFIGVLDDFIGGKYGNVDDNVKIQAVVRAMIMSRSDIDRVHYYFNKIIKIIRANRGIMGGVDTFIKNVINSELGYHYIDYYNDYSKAQHSYEFVINDINTATNFTGNTTRLLLIQGIVENNLNITSTRLQHIYEMDDIVKVDIGKMYEIIHAGFIIHAIEKGTKKWFNWKQKERYKEIFVLIIELYSQIKNPLCGKTDINAINECILTYTSDPPLLDMHTNTITLVERKYNVTFDKKTMKFKWYF